LKEFQNIRENSLNL